MQKTNRLHRLLAVIVAVFMAVSCLPLNAFAAVGDQVRVHYVFMCNGEEVSRVDSGLVYAVGDKFSYSMVENYLPEGYELDETGEFTVPDKTGDKNTAEVIVKVKSIATEKTVNINFYDEVNQCQVGEATVTVDINANNINVSKIEIPAGYEPTVTGDLPINDNWVYVGLKPVATEKTVNINFYDEVNQCQVGEATVTVDINANNINVSKIEIPAGYEPTVTGDLPINDNWVYVGLKPVTQANAIVNIRYMDGDTFVAGGDYPFPAGSSVAFGSLTLPAGYELDTSKNNAESGFMAKDGAKIIVHVKKSQQPSGDVIMNIRFMDGDTFVAGGDYTLPAGVQNYNVLGKYVPEGYIMEVSGDFMVTAGGKLDVPVKKIENAVIMNIRFVDNTTSEFVAGGDYFLPAGVQNYNVLTQYVPEGYKLAVSGDFTVAEGTSLDVPVDKIPAQIIMNIRFMDGDTFVAGGDYFLAEGVHNYKDLEDLGYLPTGYEMDVAGDFMAKDGGKLDVPVHKVKDESGTDGSESGNSGSSSSNNNTTTATNNQNGENKAQVVKSDAPADNSVKVLPQTGLTAEQPLVFGGMLFSALGSAAAYLFAIRRKLN